MISTRSKMALKPYLESITAVCENLSKDELTGMILSLAKEVPVSGRVEFLAKIESSYPDKTSKKQPHTESVEELLDNIEALRESIAERIESIEDGTYWDSADGWDDRYDDEDPDYVTEEQLDEVSEFFDEAGMLFVNDQLDEARKVYASLFDLIHKIEDQVYFSLETESDIREARARYCRCVYETSGKGNRLKDFVKSMAIDEDVLGIEDLSAEKYPMMQDVIDARPGEMKDFNAFLLAWEKKLSKPETGDRRAELLLEAVYRIEGIKGVKNLARKWKNKQPRGFVFWLRQLKSENAWDDVIEVGIEALNNTDEGSVRERVAQFVIEAGQALNDAKNVLLGKREKFFSHVCDKNLLVLMDEAVKQGEREKELNNVLDFMQSQKRQAEDKQSLFVKILLMAGRLDDAFEKAQKAKSVGWSYGVAGIVFGSIMSMAADHSKKATVIKRLLEGYASKTYVYSMSFSIEEEPESTITFYDEIVKGMQQDRYSEAQKTKYMKWAKKIGEQRIDHIVSNKHRRAYNRAALVLGSLAEAQVAMGSKNTALTILNKFYKEKYSRFSAFRSEVESVVNSSGLLDKLPF